MIRNYLKITIRNLVNNRLFSFINIVGLSIGIACTFLLILNIQNELSYDRFIDEGERIYRVALNRIYPENEVGYAVIPPSIGEAMENDFPEVENCTRVMSLNNEIILQLGEKQFKERNVILADSNFFEFFNFQLIEGNQADVLKNPTGFVLTESTAHKYFGDSTAVGKTITTGFGEIMVTGVCMDIPETSHFRFDFAGNLRISGVTNAPNYTSFAVKTYLKLAEGTDAHKLEEKFPELVKKYAAGQIESGLGVSYEDYIAAGNGYDYYLQPIRSIHLNSHLENEIKPNGNIIYVYIFIAVAVFLLVIACINFMNLSTARSADRAREVGMRKVLGGQKSQLIWQFLIESLSISFISVILAAALTELLLPAFNNLAGKTLDILYFGDWYTIPLLVILGLLVGFFAGSYPSFVLSALEPLQFIKGRFSSSKTGIILRNALVVFQFSISIILMAITFLVAQQMNLLMNKDLGFSRDDVVILERRNLLRDQTDAFKQELLNSPGILSAAVSNTLISGGYYFGMFFQTDKMSSEVITSRGMVIDEDFVETLGLEILEGRAFDRSFNDSLSIILNESAVQEFDIKDPIGSKIFYVNDQTGHVLMTIVGIVKDFHYSSLHQDIKSFVFMSSTGLFGGGGNLNIKIKPDNQGQTLAYIEQKWSEFVPGQPITYSFLDDGLNNMYSNEKNSGRIFGISSLLAIAVASIGLFGLAAYVAQNRTREIGIRKVLGSTVSAIILLLSGNFAKLVSIAFIIATPLAFLAMKKWLQNFAYQVSISFWVIILAGISALFIALITISFHTFRVANSNPSDSLRHE